MSQAVDGTNKIVLISGCSSGIGYAVAHGLRADGWRVFATARDIEDVDALQAEGFDSFVLDVADSDSIAAGVARLLAQTDGRLDALFNNAGFGLPGAVEDLSRAAMRHQFETNVFGSIELTNALLPVMRKQGQGRVIFNSSILGFAAMPYRGAYNASKFALEGFADTLRQELHGSGVQVVLVEPGPISSRFRANAQAQFEQWVGGAGSFHEPAYQAMRARLVKEGPASPFTLSPDAVLLAVRKALQARRPAARYRVTLPTRAFWYLKRLLPTCLLDRMLLAASGDEPGVAYGRRRA